MKNSVGLSRELQKLLRLKASAEEEKKLLEMGLDLKKPTRMTVIAAGLYKKASSGDLSAMKELIALTLGNKESGGVTLIDDIGSSK